MILGLLWMVRPQEVEKRLTRKGASMSDSVRSMSLTGRWIPRRPWRRTGGWKRNEPQWRHVHWRRKGRKRTCKAAECALNPDPSSNLEWLLGALRGPVQASLYTRSELIHMESEWGEPVGHSTAFDTVYAG